MGTKILSAQSYQFSFFPFPIFIFFTWILLQSLWPFPLAFLVYLSCFSFSLTSNLYCSKWLFLLVDEVLLPLKYNSQRQSHKWGNQSFSYEVQQNCFSFIQPQKFPRDFPLPYLLPAFHFTKGYNKKKRISLTKKAAILFSLSSHPPKKHEICKTWKYHGEIATLLSIFKRY